MEMRVKRNIMSLLVAALFTFGQLTHPVQAQITTTVTACGTVTAYTAATAAVPGLITCGGQTFPIAPGVTLVNADLITIGANLCLSATLNAAGQIILPSTVTANVTTTVNVCGAVSAFVAATASMAGSITINGQNFVITPGTTLNGQALAAAGVNACLSATLNANAQIIVPSTITVNASATVNVCGVVSAFVTATAGAPGSITCGGQNFVIAASTTINGQAQIAVGLNMCLSATLNASGQIIAPSTITANASATVNVCGVVNAFVAATASAPGSITINGQNFVITAGTTINGEAQVAVGVNACLSATLNASGQIILPSTVTVNVTTTVNVCGAVSAFVAATASAAGSLTCGGQNFVITAGTTINGQAQVAVGVNACLSATLNASGQIIPPSTITVNASATVNVCGVVSAFVAATASASGSIVCGGQNFVITAGTTINGQAQIAVGLNMCLSATLNAGGQIILPSTITVNASATVNVCGVVSAFVAATASAPGSITINGQNFVITTGTTINGQAQIAVGVNVCLNATLNLSGQITPPTTIVVNPPPGGNHSPVISVPGPQIIEAGKTLTFTVTGSDQDTGDVVTLTSSSLPPNASFNAGSPGNPVTGMCNFSPANNQVGDAFSITFTATDNKGATASGSVQIFVIGPAANQTPGPPTISVPPSPIIIQVGTTLNFTVAAMSPVHGCAVGLSASGVPDHSTFEASSGKFSFTPGADQKDKSFLVTFTATDCFGQSITGAVTIMVVDVISVGGNPSPGQICVPVTKVFFEATPVNGGCAGFIMLSLVNKGGSALRIESIKLLDGRHFRVEGVAGLPVMLQSAGVIQLKLSFEPKESGTLVDSLTIGTSDPNNPTVTISLKGKGSK